MDRFESQKLNLQDLVKNHHTAEALSKDIEEIKKKHPEATKLGVCHESFSDNEHNDCEVTMKKWGMPG